MILTIFTPVYNRAHLIHKLYDSLINQTNQNFVWLIVDDGSTDNIKNIIEEYRKSAKFEVRYIYQENQGKHTAHNLGVANCNTELFFCVDSDDFLTSNAVERIYEIHDKYSGHSTLGYYFRKMDTQNKISGGKFLFNNELVGLSELYFNYGFVGELAIILKTDLIKPYAFPVFAGERFVSENVFYNQITSIAPMVWVDEVIYIFEYQQTGYTLNSSKLLLKNPRGVAMGYLSNAIYGTKIIDRAKAYAAFIAMKKVFKITSRQYCDSIIPKSIKLIGTLLKNHYKKLFKNLKKLSGMD